MPLSQIPRFEIDDRVKINIYAFEELRTIQHNFAYHKDLR